MGKTENGSWAGLGWAGEVPRKGVGPQRRGVADQSKRAWLRGTETANQEEFIKGRGK